MRYRGAKFWRGLKVRRILVSAIFYGQPVKMFKDRGDMFLRSSCGDDLSSCVLDKLKLILRGRPERKELQ